MAITWMEVQTGVKGDEERGEIGFIGGTKWMIGEMISNYPLNSLQILLFSMYAKDIVRIKHILCVCVCQYK